MKRHARIIALKVELYDSLSEICTVNFLIFTRNCKSLMEILQQSTNIKTPVKAPNTLRIAYFNKGREKDR